MGRGRESGRDPRFEAGLPQGCGRVDPSGWSLTDEIWVCGVGEEGDVLVRGR